MEIDKISFGTKPQIGCISVENGLTKYNKNLTDGITDAFVKLSKNGVDDGLTINIKGKKNAKKRTTDILQIIYSNKANGIETLKSALNLSPKSLQKLSAKEISKKILTVYEQLTNSSKFKTDGIGYPVGLRDVKLSQKHKESLINLRDNYGFDDWTCA